jgi:hypothetical protein
LIGHSQTKDVSLVPPQRSSPLGLVLAPLAQFVVARRRAISDARS